MCVCVCAQHSLAFFVSVYEILWEFVFSKTSDVFSPTLSRVWGQNEPQAVSVRLCQEFSDANHHPWVQIVSQCKAVAVHDHIHLGGSVGFRNAAENQFQFRLQFPLIGLEHQGLRHNTAFVLTDQLALWMPNFISVFLQNRIWVLAFSLSLLTTCYDKGTRTSAGLGGPAYAGGGGAAAPSGGLCAVSVRWAKKS